MKLSIYQIDAFADKPFEGNPAAVVPLRDWLPDATMQAIAEENNLAETAFFVPVDNGFHIRWFTPTKEVKLCGHATLASAFVLYTHLGYTSDQVSFQSLSGPLTVSRKEALLELNFPNQKPETCEAPQALVAGLGKTPVECLSSEDYVAVLGSAQEVAELAPDLQQFEQLDLRGVIITAPAAPGPDCDFVARFFAPKYGIPEDPVTGSAYTQLAPYWAERLGRQLLKAKQISKRGGQLLCEVAGDRVLIAGSAVAFLEGSIEV